MSKVKYKGKGFAGVKSGGKDRKHWADQLDAVRFTSQYEGKNILLRIVSDLFPEGTHWIYTDTDDLGKNAYGSNFKGKKFMVVCPDWNPEEEKSSKETCYVCKHCSSPDMLGGVKINWYVQAFIAKKKNGKIKWSDDPVVLVLPTTAINEIKNMMETVGNGVEPNDPKHGYGIWLTYTNSGKGKASWSAQKDKEISLKELGMSKDDIIDFGEYFEATPAKDIEESMERLGYVDLIENGGKKKKSKSVDDDEDEDDDDEEDNILGDDDEEEDEKPSKKKKSKKDDDEDEDDEDDDDDSDDDEYDEDEKPKKKNKSNKFDDDDEDDSDDDDSEDEDDDEDDDDDDDDEPKKKKKKSKKFDDDDDDDDENDSDDEDEDDEDEDDEYEDDEPKKKKKKSNKFDDDDDEDEDEKPKKKKKSKKFDDDDDD